MSERFLVNSKLITSVSLSGDDEVVKEVEKEVDEEAEEVEKEEEEEEEEEEEGRRMVFPIFLYISMYALASLRRETKLVDTVW